MNTKGFSWIAAFACILAALSGRLGAQSSQDDEAAPFRETFFMSEVEREAGVAQAVRVGGVVFVSATTARGESFEAQMRTIYMRIQSTLGQYGLSLADVAQERIFVLDLELLDAALPVRKRFYLGDAQPASTWVRVAGLPGTGHLLSIEVIAVANPEEE